jgi:hypothetical protein
MRIFGRLVFATFATLLSASAVQAAERLYGRTRVILRLIFAVALIPGGSGIAVVNSALADNGGFGIPLSINAPLEQNTDRPGADFTNFDIQPSIAGLGTAETTCQNACVNNSSCRAWTLVKPGIQGPNARCWLKSSVPGKRSNGCCTSGAER